MKGKKFIISALLVVMLVASNVLADARISYTYDVGETPAVFSMAFDCEDAACATTSPFSGIYPDNPNANPSNFFISDTDGNVRINYPTLLAAQSYGVYFWAPGFVIHERSVTAAGNGALNAPLTFEQAPTCGIDATVFTNSLSLAQDANVAVGEPIPLSVDVTLNDPTRNGLNPGELEFIPDALRLAYSVGAFVTLEVTDSEDNVVHRETKRLNVFENGGELFIDETRTIDFDFTPTQTGDFTLTVSSQVEDGVCANTNPDEEIERTIHVHEGINSCRATASSATINPEEILFGGTTTITLPDLTSTFFDNQGQPTNVETRFVITLVNETGTLREEFSGFFPARNDPAEEFSVEITPDILGDFDVLINATPNSESCVAESTISAELEGELVVNDPALVTFDLTFQVINAVDLQPLNEVTITIESTGAQGATGTDGRLTFEGLRVGLEGYSLEKEGFQTVSDVFNIPNPNLDNFLVTMLPVGASTDAPEFTAVIPDQTLEEDGVSLNAIDLRDFVSDADTAFENLVFSIEENSNPGVGVTVNTGGFIDIQPAPNFFGESQITLSVTDGTFEVNTTFNITVTAVEDEPTINLDTFVVSGVRGASTLLNLSEHVSDPEQDARTLVWTITTQNPNVAASITEDILQVVPSVSGLQLITLTVTDNTGLSVSQDLRIFVDIDVQPECNDGIDNDFDGLIDFPADPGCLAATDNEELDPPRDPFNRDPVREVVVPEPDFFISSIRVADEYAITAGSQMFVTVNFENEGSTRMEDTKLVASIPELGLRRAAGADTVSIGDRVQQGIVLDIPEWVPPGFYVLRININGNEMGASRIVHRPIEILPAPIMAPALTTGAQSPVQVQPALPTEHLVTVAYCPQGQPNC